MQTPLLTTCKRILILSILILSSCQPEVEIGYTQTVALKNDSELDFKLIYYHRFTIDPETGQAIKREEILLRKGETVSKTYISVTPPNQASHYIFGNTSHDSIVLIFPNGKGYYAAAKENKIGTGEDTGTEIIISTEHWINGKSPLFRIDRKDLLDLNGILTYPITQQDYENAHDLP
ncbi:hypothetical protein ACTS95_10115 [Empedobacter brevis]